MALIQITRDDPPALGCCRARRCEAQIEWVRTHVGRRMPVNAPLIIARITEDLWGNRFLWIEDSTVHWVTCREPETFTRKQRGGHR
jgi:hypothetical protein